MSNRLQARLLAPTDRDVAVAYLQRDARGNLQLLELASRLGRRGPPTEVAPQLAGTWRGPELAGVISLRPSLVLDSRIDDENLDVLMPLLDTVPSGLIKSSWDAVTSLWKMLGERDRAFLVDRAETAYELRRECATNASPEPLSGAEVCTGVEVRTACESDLDELVAAARASLREEGRPDPFDGDPPGFRRWVRGRLSRARVVVAEGRIRFVGYADVRRPEGWLVQGVYTFPEARRRGFAAVGMSALIREAFDADADHVQLAVVSGNVAAVHLYEKLGFEPFASLRTVLFI